MHEPTEIRKNQKEQQKTEDRNGKAANKSLPSPNFTNEEIYQSMTELGVDAAGYAYWLKLQEKCQKKTKSSSRWSSFRKKKDGSSGISVQQRNKNQMCSSIRGTIQTAPSVPKTITTSHQDCTKINRPQDMVKTISKVSPQQFPFHTCQTSILRRRASKETKSVRSKTIEPIPVKSDSESKIRQNGAPITIKSNSRSNGKKREQGSMSKSAQSSTTEPSSWSKMKTPECLTPFLHPLSKAISIFTIIPPEWGNNDDDRKPACCEEAFRRRKKRIPNPNIRKWILTVLIWYAITLQTTNGLFDFGITIESTKTIRPNNAVAINRMGIGVQTLGRSHMMFSYDVDKMGKIILQLAKGQKVIRTQIATLPTDEWDLYDLSSQERRLHFIQIKYNTIQDMFGMKRDTTTDEEVYQALTKTQNDFALKKHMEEVAEQVKKAKQKEPEIKSRSKRDLSRALGRMARMISAVYPNHRGEVDLLLLHTENLRKLANGEATSIILDKGEKRRIQRSIDHMMAHSRSKRAIFGILGTIASTLMGAYTTIQLTKLQGIAHGLRRDLGEVVLAVDEHAYTLGTHSEALQSLFKTTSSIPLLELKFHMLEKSMMMNNAMDEADQMIDHLFMTSVFLLQGKIFPGAFKSTQMIAQLEVLKKKVGEQGYRLLITDLNELYQCTTSFMAKEGKIDIFIHIAVAIKEDIMTTYHYIPLPVIGASGYFQEFVTGNNQVIMVSESQKTWKVMTSDELLKCDKMGEVFMCRKGNVAKTFQYANIAPRNEACLFHLEQQDFYKINSTCDLKIYNDPPSFVRQLDSNQFVIYSTRPLYIADIKCGDGVTDDFEVKARTNLNLKPGCTARTQDATMTAGADMGAGVPVRAYDWSETEYPTFELNPVQQARYEFNMELTKSGQIMRSNIFNEVTKADQRRQTQDALIHKMAIARRRNMEWGHNSETNTLALIAVGVIITLISGALAALTIYYCIKRKEDLRRVKNRFTDAVRNKYNNLYPSPDVETGAEMKPIH